MPVTTLYTDWMYREYTNAFSVLAFTESMNSFTMNTRRARGASPHAASTGMTAVSPFSGCSTVAGAGRRVQRSARSRRGGSRTRHSIPGFAQAEAVREAVHVFQADFHTHLQHHVLRSGGGGGCVEGFVQPWRACHALTLTVAQSSTSSCFTELSRRYTGTTVLPSTFFMLGVGSEAALRARACVAAGVPDGVAAKAGRRTARLT